MKTNRFTAPRLERLTERLAPAVQVTLSGHTLLISGDGQDDKVLVRVAPGDINIQGLNGTTVTSDVAETARFVSVRIELGGGDDEYRLEDSWVPGRLTVLDTAGDDVVSLGSLWAGDVTLRTGDGNDSVEVDGLDGRGLTVNSGSGDDRVVVSATRLLTLDVHGGVGDDAFELTDVRGLRLFVDGGAGSDTLDRADTRFLRSVVRNLTDDVPPSVRSITRTGDEVTSASTVTFTVTFNEPVTGVDATDFAVTATGTLSGRVSRVTQVSGAVYTVTVTDLPIAGTGTIGLNLVNDGSIKDATHVRLVGGTFVGEAYTVEVSAIDAYMNEILALIPDIATEPTSPIYQGIDSPTVKGALEQVSANWGRAYEAASTITPVAGLEALHAKLVAAVAAERDAAALAASLTDPALPNTGENYNAAYHYAPDAGYARADRLGTRVELILAAKQLGYSGDTPFGAPADLVDKPAYNTPDDPVQEVTLTQRPLNIGGMVIPNFANFEYDTVYADVGDFTFYFVNENPAPFVFNIAVYKVDEATANDPSARVTVDQLVGQTDAFQGAKTHVLTLEDLEPGYYVFVDNVHPTEMRGVLIVRDYAPEVEAVAAAADATGTASSVTFTVTFSEDVTGVDAGDFAVTTTGDLTGGRVSAVTPVSGSVYQVTVTGYTIPQANSVPVSGSGTVGLTVTNNGTITDAAGQALADTGDPGEPVAVELTALDAYMNVVLSAVPNVFSSTAVPSAAPTAQEAILEQADVWAAIYDRVAALTPPAGLEGEHAAVLAGVQAEEDAARLTASLTDPTLPNTPEITGPLFLSIPESGYARYDRLAARERLRLAAVDRGYVPPAGVEGAAFGPDAPLVDTPAYNTADTPVQAVTLVQRAAPADPSGFPQLNINNFEYDIVYAEAGDFTFTFVNENPPPFAFNIALYRLDGPDTTARVSYDDVVARTELYSGPYTHVLTVEDLEPGVYVYLDDAHPTQMRGLLIVS
jgi:hypothetical protein